MTPVGTWSVAASRPRISSMPSTTMGIYCRPGCPSPRPQRENVRFFADVGRRRGRRLSRLPPLRPARASGPRWPARWCATPAPSSRRRKRSPRWNAWRRGPAIRGSISCGCSSEHTGLTPRSYAEGVRARRLQAALAERRPGRRRGGGGRIRLRSRGSTRIPARLLGMTPGALRRGGAGRDHPHRLRRLPVRPPAGRRHRHRRVLPRLRRARRRADGRPAPPLPAAPAWSPTMPGWPARCGRCSISSRNRRRALDAAARPARHRVPAPGVGGAAPDPAGRDPQLFRARRAWPARRRRCGRWRGPARPTRCRWPCPAIARWGRTASLPATAGASRASRRCSPASARRPVRHNRTDPGDEFLYRGGGQRGAGVGTPCSGRAPIVARGYLIAQPGRIAPARREGFHGFQAELQSAACRTDPGQAGQAGRQAAREGGGGRRAARRRRTPASRNRPTPPLPPARGRAP